MSARAWAPGHATLFFAVPDQIKDPLRMGSLGGGFNFDAGVTTTVSNSESDEVYWNGSIIEGEVTLTALDILRERSGILTKVTVHHISDIPIGYGLSTSGAGAISALLAANKLFNLSYTDLELYQIAHLADLKHHTGLGSVLAQIRPGIELRLTQGGPGFAIVESFLSDRDIAIIFIAPLKTSEVLTSPKQVSKLTKIGVQTVVEAQNIKKDFAIQFIQIGQRFMKNCGLSTKRIEQIQHELLQIGEDQSTMAMIGETLIILPQNRDKLMQFIDVNNLQSLFTKITSKKPHLVKI